MQSKTKYNISGGQVKAIFEAAGLGPVTGFESLSDGWYNNVLDVSTTTGDCVVKIAPEPSVRVLTHEKDLLKQELRYIALLREHGVAVPEVYRSDLGKGVIPCDWFAMEKLQGLRLDKAGLKGGEKQSSRAQIQEMLAGFHAIAAEEGFGYEQMGLEPNWYLALRKIVRALIDDCAAFSRRCPKGEKLLRMLDRHRAILEAVPGVLVNFDLHASNLFWHNGKLTAIDLERCFWGDWIGDCVYRSLPAGASREEKIRFHLMTCYLAVIMYTEKYSRYRPWNGIWWLDVLFTFLFWHRSWPALKLIYK